MKKLINRIKLKQSFVTSLIRNIDLLNKTIDVDKIVVRRSIKFVVSTAISESLELKQFFISSTKTSFATTKSNFRNFEQSNEIIDVDEIIARRSIKSFA